MNWSDADSATAIKLVKDLLGGAPPSQVPELIEKIIENSNSDKSIRRQRLYNEQIGRENEEKVNKLYLRLRSYYLRWFVLTPETLKMLMVEEFGREWMVADANLLVADRIKKRAGNLKDQWKSKSIEKFKALVTTLTKDDDLARTETNADKMFKFFDKTWDVEA